MELGQRRRQRPWRGDTQVVSDATATPAAFALSSPLYLSLFHFHGPQSLSVKVQRQTCGDRAQCATSTAYDDDVRHASSSGGLINLFLLFTIPCLPSQPQPCQRRPYTRAPGPPALLQENKECRQVGGQGKGASLLIRVLLVRSMAFDSAWQEAACFVSAGSPPRSMAG